MVGGLVEAVPLSPGALNCFLKMLCATELFCNRVIVLFDPPATWFRRIPKTRTGYAAAVTAVYIVGESRT
jgi:regulator of sirC expression with transglutaminase-like and TPR domain